MRATVLSLLALAAAVAPAAQAAPRITGPAQVQPGGFAELTVEGAKPGTVMWLVVSPDPVQQDEIAERLVFTGTPGATYTAVAVVVDFDAKTMAKVRYQVAFLGTPGPPPPPVPPPDPPAPADPLAVALKAAAKADGWPAAKLAALSIGFRVAAARVDRQPDLADIQGVAAAALKENAPDKTPPTVRAVLAKELAALDGPDRPATDADRAAIKALFSRLAAALDGASK